MTLVIRGFESHQTPEAAVGCPYRTVVDNGLRHCPRRS